MAAHSSTLAWEISWTEEPGGLQARGSQRVAHDLVTKQKRGEVTIVKPQAAAQRARALLRIRSFWRMECSQPPSSGAQEPAFKKLAPTLHHTLHARCCFHRLSTGRLLAPSPTARKNPGASFPPTERGPCALNGGKRKASPSFLMRTRHRELRK